jgi:cytochrome c peroxidase
VNKLCLLVLLVIATLAVVSTVSFAVPQTAGARAGADEYQWKLPKDFPKPRVPADNPMTPAKVYLGTFLFYDQRMSGNGTESCATCHRQALAFTDGKAQAVGSTGQLHPRGAMSLVNVAYSAALTWSNPNEHSPEHQALTPMFGDHPVELGLTGKGEAFLDVLRSDSLYRILFPAAFPAEQDPFTIQNVT